MSTSGGVLTSDYGNVVNNGNNSWTVTDIPNGQNIIVTATTSIGCESLLEIEAPNCTCIELDYDYSNVTCNGLNDGTIIVNYVTEGATVTINGQPYDENALYAAGNYTIMAFFEGVDISDCIISETFEITEPEVVNISVSHTNVTCHGANDGTITVTSLSEGATYTIQLNGYGPDLSGQTTFAPGNYLVVATVDDGSTSRMVDNSNLMTDRYGDPCIKSRLVTITDPAPLNCSISYKFKKYPFCKQDKRAKNVNMLIANTTGGTGAVTYSWSVDETSAQNGWSINSDPTAQTIKFIAGYGYGIFNLTTTDVNGCQSECSVQLFAKCLNNSSGSNNVFSRFDTNYLEVYPNPTKGMLNIKFTETIDSDMSVEVFDLVGTVMYSKKYSDFRDSNLSIDFSKFPSQVYYLKVTSNKGTVVKKVILDK